MSLLDMYMPLYRVCEHLMQAFIIFSVRLLRVVRSTPMGNSRASKCGTGKSKALALFCFTSHLSESRRSIHK